MNNDMCCYDGGDCPSGDVFYEKLPFTCNIDTCDNMKFGDGVCDKFEKNICCMDKLDCVDSKQILWDELTCNSLSLWSLYDTCPRCCNV